MSRKKVQYCHSWRSMSSRSATGYSIRRGPKNSWLNRNDLHGRRRAFHARRSLNLRPADKARLLQQRHNGVEQFDDGGDSVPGGEEDSRDGPQFWKSLVDS